MISNKEVKVLDINSEYYGVKTNNLMENAGKGVSDFIKNNLKIKEINILVVCGKGNNGGDGFVTARYLSNKYKVTLLLLSKESEIHSKIAKNNFKKLKKCSLKILNIKSVKNFDNLLKENKTIVDAMLGVGITGSLKEPYKTIVKKINIQKNKTIISVDIPTGFSTDLSIKPNYTITFHDKKENMNKKNCGKIKIVDIKIPKKAEEYIGPGELITFYKKPDKNSHKGKNGVVLMLGGGPYTGAPALSTFAALRTGADLVFITTPKTSAKAITSSSKEFIKAKRLAKEISKLSPNLIIKELNHENKLVLDDFKIIKEYIKKADSVIIGPGLGKNPETKKTIIKIFKELKKLKKSIVIDADAIEVAGENKESIKNTNTIITPHTREFTKLTNVKISNDINKTKKEVKKWAEKLGVTILLKGPIDIISDGENIKLNDIHNEAMTVGGTGDVLAGICGCLLSKKIKPYNAARMAAFINGEAGNYAFEKRSYGLISTDIIDEIPNVLKKYL